jgi:hypothetical protein
MRTRDEILTDLHKAFDSDDGPKAMGIITAVQFEVLLDIRELLREPRTVTVNLSGSLIHEEYLMKTIQDAIRKNRL